ncbi:unnamed protein product [Paramecium primaurelia]|uniref:Mitochondrial carrier protein n=2 Tax=Paramecium TaxID=5884 RepID=A0A8S1SP64_9CILI|nr:unnamed protein product [Paramecium primaurelia]CAD8140192.1 unnamed protein product [Paramecium pentaurelia]
MSETTQWIYKGKELLKPIVETQLIGVSRAILGLPMDHFFDRFKTLIQASQNSNFKQLFLESYYRNGIFRGIFAGFSSQISIQLFKQYYRWPMMIFIPKFYMEVLPTKIKESAPALHKGLAGITIALFESLVTCPFERVKCQLMTQQQSKSVLKYMWEHDGGIKGFTRDLFTGMEVMILKQVVSWTNYLYWDHRVRYYFKERPSQKLTVQEIVLCSIFTAIPNIIIVQPFDMIKTQFQMENNHQIKHLSIWNAFKKVYLEKGITGFYAGWQMRFCQFMFQALLTTPVMDYLERQHGIPLEVL